MNSAAVENLIELTYLNEPEMLRCLEERFMKSLIYSYTGPVLIALNPSNVVVPDESSERLFSQFMRRVVSESLPESLSTVSTLTRNTIIINGESGSGKTECTRLFLKSLLDVSESGFDVDTVERQEEVILTLINCGGIIESFGNAKLVHSSNSSRFGRYINLEMDRRGALVGGEIKSYLLENIRVVKQQAGERNFHIFHRLMTGASEEEKARLRLDQALDCHYLPPVDSAAAEEIDLASLKETLFALGVDVTEVNALLDVVASVLHIGKLQFEPFFENAVEGSKVVEEDAAVYSSADVVADLLKLPVEDLKLALTTRSVVSARETFQARLKVGQSTHVRDSVAKLVYKKAFDWITGRLNGVLQKFKGPETVAHINVGILDVFGFDAFESNGLEQLCINYANETLQQLFNQHMFKLEMIEYERENIPFQSVEYPDNQKSIDVIHSLFKILDDQCRIPNATDKRLAQVLTKDLNSSGRYTSSGAQQVAGKFNIIHFAGPVQYSSEGFIEKNTDELPQEALQLLQRSGNAILAVAEAKETAGSDTAATERSPMARAVSRRASTTRNAPSAVTQFQNELKVLLKEIGATTQHFVRCINPVGKRSHADAAAAAAAAASSAGHATIFNQKDVAEQLSYGGILSAMQISRSGYSGRYALEDFYSRYRNLVPSQTLTLRNAPDGREKCQELVRVLSTPSDMAKRQINVRALAEYEHIHGEPVRIDAVNVPVGLSKVFLKKNEKVMLDWLRHNIIVQSSKKIFRFIFHRRRPKGLQLRDYVRLIVRLQATLRAFTATRKFRRYLAHKRQQEQQAAAVQMQAFSPSPVKGLIRKRSSFFGDMAEADLSGADGIPADVALASKVAKQARERKNTAAKVGEYKKLDEKLLKEINQLIAAKRVSDETALLRFDIPRARQLLLEWSVNYTDEIFAAVNEVAGAMDYGFNLLLPDKLVPMSMLGKMMSLGRTVKPENRSATNASKNVTKDHKMFKQVMIIMEKIKELIEKLQALRKAMEAISKSRENYNSPLMICYKTIDFLRILHQYYYQYVIHFVEEFGDGSVYKQQFGADEARYVRELAALVSLRQPLLQVEKRNQDSTYGVFPITLSAEALHPEGVVSTSGDSVVFRLIHCAPGLEYACNCLFMMLQQEVVMYPIRFIKLVGKSALNYGQIAFYQAANDFTGETLANVVDEPRLLDLIDARSYSVAFLSTVLSGALRAQPRNYMIKSTRDAHGQATSVSILGVINDVEFCPQLFHPESYVAQHATAQPHENVLFTCPQLMMPLDPEVRDALLSHPAVAAEVVSSWIRELYRQNVRYNGLVESGFTESDLQRLMVPISVPRYAAVQVYFTLLRIVDFLKARPQATHGDVLAILHPALAQQYGIFVQDYRQLPHEHKSQRLSSVFSFALQDLKPPNEQFTIDRIDLDNFNTTVEEAAVEFLKQVDFSTFTDEKSLTSCAQIGDNLSFLSALWLRNVNDEQLAVMFGVVIHMAFKMRKQKKENFGAKLFTKAIFLTGLDEDETRLIQESVIFNRIHDLLGMHVYFEDPAPGPKPKPVDDEDYGHGIEDVKLEF